MRTPAWEGSVRAQAKPALRSVPSSLLAFDPTALSSSEVPGVPSGAFGFEHRPVVGSQMPATWHWSLAWQTTLWHWSRTATDARSPRPELNAGMRLLYASCREVDPVVTS